MRSPQRGQLTHQEKVEVEMETGRESALLGLAYLLSRPRPTYLPDVGQLLGDGG